MLAQYELYQLVTYYWVFCRKTKDFNAMRESSKKENASFVLAMSQTIMSTHKMPGVFQNHKFNTVCFLSYFSSYYMYKNKLPVQMSFKK